MKPKYFHIDLANRLIKISAEQIEKTVIGEWHNCHEKSEVQANSSIKEILHALRHVGKDRKQDKLLLWRRIALIAICQADQIESGKSL